jgi:4-hydroxy-tetrahydrodipicolinate synthase
MNFGQVLTAMVTPFDSDGNVDLAQTTVLVDYLLENGTEGLVIAGTTGESPTLTKEEKLMLFKHVVKVVNNRVPVIAGTGSNDTTSSIGLTKEAEACGVDAIMLVTPYYNKPSQMGLYTHFSAIADLTTLPVMLYNIPGRSVVNMSAETIIRLSKIKNIVSVKEASGDLDQVADIIERTAEDFSVYSGDDGLTLPMLSIGADGVVSVASHIIGNEMCEMVQHFIQGDVKQAAAEHRRLLPIMKGLFTSPSPTPVKAALQMKGIETGGVRLPLVPLTENEEKELKQLIDQ